ncbi:TetR/AcrR family transcriptional regulator [Paenibacillus sp. Dod16]|uniref:TetR/AcrR family transcriptional regulator n=1 Tax=Paenibacillus sp. Dod16 TaxID=3416392 RepID=UPI003CF393D5
MEHSDNLSTDDKLLLAAIDLISRKGYNGVTTLEIATAAGLSEKTLFRKFGSKQNLLETAFARYHYGQEMTKLFEEKLVGDLSEDLLLISRTYHELMIRNRKLITISVKENDNLPGLRVITSKHPKQYMDVLTKYFTVMTEKGKVIAGDPELRAISFMMMNFGAFMNELDSEELFSSVTLDAFIEEGVRIFARALTP